MPRHPQLSALLLTLAFTGNAHADLFGKLDQALPAKISITANHPVFDFDSDGCLPSAGISREGKQNGGLNPSGSLGGGCRATSFLDSSNTLHRYACIASGSDTYCGHFYALYFLKDQISTLGGGHRHDWEHAAVWTKNGVVTHAGYSAHGKLYNAEIGTLAQQSGHVKIVYHKDGVSTHALRFASSGEAAENSYGSFVAPQIISWYALKGDGVSNATMRANLNSFDYGSASIPLKDSNFLSNLNTYKPASYPSFTQASIDASQ
ncbi:NPP1 family protein [Uliginosibacterium sp. TH139]|uniref:NPP1 family protein n=1 Tax=Uliginosibacterium sp. TH139 TaxID=2067453 RepID=UPI000C7D28DD|nr:NPP1 family protein [Uliginosibacterium sp. TH139]PLK50574.1 sugar-binding protein [Uliginosibacterium sp. TH139]